MAGWQAPTGRALAVVATLTSRGPRETTQGRRLRHGIKVGTAAVGWEQPARRPSHALVTSGHSGQEGHPLKAAVTARRPVVMVAGSERRAVASSEDVTMAAAAGRPPQPRRRAAPPPLHLSRPQPRARRRKRPTRVPRPHLWLRCPHRCTGDQGLGALGEGTAELPITLRRCRRDSKMAKKGVLFSPCWFQAVSHVHCVSAFRLFDALMVV